MKRLLFPAVTALAALVACGELFDDPVQCTTDKDCAKFASAVCSTAKGVCTKGGAENDDDGGDGTTSGGSTSGTSATSGGSTSGAPDPDPDSGAIPDKCKGTKAATTIPATITTAVTLGCDKDWTLDVKTFVKSGGTLTIEAGTTIKAKKGASLIVSRGGKLVADGKRDVPIVITSAAAAPAAGDWSGVFILGNAGPAGQPPYLGDPDLAWGGNAPDDTSGVLSYVRIEYPQLGLVFAGTGSKTKIDFVQVRRSADNCFMFFGGNAFVKHLVCQSTADDQFEWWFGAMGKAQFLYGQKAALPPVFGSGGILVDDGRPQIFNATVCGDTKQANLNGYGVVYRDGATLNLSNAIVSGWFSGLDATGTMNAPGGITSSVVFGNNAPGASVAFVEDTTDDPSSPDFDDDNGLDELDDFNNANNSTADPKLGDCFDPKAPKPYPATAVTANAATPPGDGFFDATAKYVGAFKDGTDTWMQGAWVRFDDK